MKGYESPLESDGCVEPDVCALLSADGVFPDVASTIAGDDGATRGVWELLDAVGPSEHETDANQHSRSCLECYWVVVAMNANAAFADDLDGDERCGRGGEQ